ncbi:MAG TPA: glycosyltransferase family 2 protein [Nocardioidaceae bacterium]|nr:glycosyltransferase family 2 protein [Nocardioidaceae bacterium]
MTAVSVVVPTYNNAAHVGATLDSILNQTFRDFELVVSDHSSDDATWEIVQRYAADPRVQLYRVDPGGGAERNWNHATGLATAPLLKLVCGDDVLESTCLERQVSAFEEQGEGVVMVASPRRIIDSGGRPIMERRGLEGLAGRTPAAEAVRRTVRAGTNILGEPACVMFRRDALRAVGGWQGQDGYIIDLRTYLRVLEHGDLVAVPEILASFRVSRQQWSVRLQREQSRQVESLFEELSARWPGVIDARDVARGCRRARLASVQRRLLYRFLARRL